VDPLGALVGTAAIALLVFGVVGSPDRGWWTATTVAILAGVLVAFVAVVERRSPDPLIPARSRAYGRGARREHRRVLVGASVFSMYLFISLYLQAHRTATTESRREWSAPRSSSAEHSAWRRWRPSLPTAPKPSSPEPLAVQTSRGAEGIQSAFVYGAGFALAGAVATLILLPRAIKQAERGARGAPNVMTSHEAPRQPAAPAATRAKEPPLVEASNAGGERDPRGGGWRSRAHDGDDASRRAPPSLLRCQTQRPSPASHSGPRFSPIPRTQGKPGNCELPCDTPAWREIRGFQGFRTSEAPDVTTNIVVSRFEPVVPSGRLAQPDRAQRRRRLLTDPRSRRRRHRTRISRATSTTQGAPEINPVERECRIAGAY
jgi:hypothetical protein